MPGEVPALRPTDVVAALKRAGFVIKRQTGSYVIMLRECLRRPISVPVHCRDIPPGTLEP